MDQASAIAFLDQYAAGAYTEAEHKEFVEWLASAPGAELLPLVDAATDAAAGKPPSETADPALVAQIEAALDAWDTEQQARQQHRTLYRRLTRFSAAAAILLILAGAWWIFRPQHPVAPPSPARYASDIPPGGNKAILTLSNGQKIILDSAHTGQLASQGSTNIIKLDSGSLTYQQAHSPLPTDHSPTYNTLTTPRGGQYRLSLPDRTEVWLNAASSITYPTAFTGASREVTITGEVYFEVAHRQAQPFRVKAGGTLIEDLGTHFNINVYPDEPEGRTTLLEGSVEIFLPSPREEGPGIKLKPGQQARTGPSGPIRVVSGVDLDETMAWKNGLFQFDRADIRTVMRQIARWYDVEVSYEGPLPGDRFWGKLPRDANASQVLRVLQKEQVHFRIEGKKIIVTQ